MARCVIGPDVALRLARDLADELEWLNTVDAEFVALTRLQADAFITRDAALALAVRGLVRVAAPGELLAL